MRRGMAVVVLVLGLAGCGSRGETAGDHRSALAAGVVRQVYSAETDRLAWERSDLGGPEALAVGTRVEVIDDRGDAGDATRYVRVKVLEGPGQGGVGGIRRAYLRPEPGK